jgi:membrane-associated phospholipid phosphatase
MTDADRELLLAMRTRWHSPGVERFIKALGKVANNGAIWFVLCFFLAIVNPGNREAWLICAVLGPLAIVLNFAIKKLVKRPRPDLGPHLPPLGGAPSSLSFPSAHATSSFAVATAMTRVDSVAFPFVLVLALTISVGRPYLGMHYPSDVVVGAILGTILGLVVPLSI